MGLILGSSIAEVLLALLLLFWIIYSYVTQKYNYWKDRNVPYSKPYFPVGSTVHKFIARKHLGELYDQFYKEFENEPFFGIIEDSRPVFVVKDPDLLKRILTKDFNHFYDRFTFPMDLKKDYLANHLFNMTGKEWKTMRMKLAPTFTSGKMKAMYLLMEQCKNQLNDYVEREVIHNPIIDIKNILARFTMDIIATCAFGLEINSLTEKDCTFYKMGVKIFTPPSITESMKIVLYFTLPFLRKLYTPSFIPKDITSFLTNLVRDTVKYREENEVDRSDFLGLLIKIRHKKTLMDENDDTIKHLLLEKEPTDDTGITIEEMAAQAFLFFAAGFETASSTMTFCLYELAQHPEVQDKLCKEVKQMMTKHEGELTYQALQEMTYMDQVINETLRRYASVPVLMRTCTEAYKIPNSDLVLEKGQQVIIPTYSIHHDPKYYPEPFKFDPERFAADRVKERHPYVHLPFGEGPRMCIGNRFGLLQTKIGLAEMVSNFNFKLSPETQVPVSIHKTSFMTMPENQILLHVTKRE